MCVYVRATIEDFFFCGYFPPYLFIFPLSCWMQRVPLIKERKFLELGEAEGHCKLCFFLDFSRALHLGESVFQFKNVSLSLTPTLPLALPPQSS